MATSLFEASGFDRWTPTELARGPWDPAACHGGPVSALIARAWSLRIRSKRLRLPDDVTQPFPDPPGSPDDAVAQRPAWAMDGHVAFHRDACEHRFTEGTWDALRVDHRVIGCSVC